MAQHFTKDRELLRIVFLRNPEIDVTPWVTGSRLTLGTFRLLGQVQGRDGVVRQALSRSKTTMKPFSPLDATSSWNYDGMVFDPLIRPNREILIYTPRLGLEIPHFLAIMIFCSMGLSAILYARKGRSWK